MLFELIIFSLGQILFFEIFGIFLSGLYNSFTKNRYKFFLRKFIIINIYLVGLITNYIGQDFTLCKNMFCILFIPLKYLFLLKEVIKDQLGALESIKIDDGITWEDECVKNQCFVGKEDFQQIMSDWQQHVGLLQVVFFIK